MNTENAIPPSIEDELMKPWDPVIKSFFHGATLNNCTLNIKINQPIKMQSKPPKMFAYFPMYAHIKIAYREGEGVKNC